MTNITFCRICTPQFYFYS